MALPKQVAAREDRANDLISKLQTTNPANTPDPSTANADPAAPLQPAPNADAAPPPNREDWKAKYLVLQGKYDAEVPRVQAENAALKQKLQQISDLNSQLQSRITAMESEINSLKTAASHAPAASSTPAGVTQEDLNRFDPELIDLAKRIAEATAKQMVDPVSKVVQETEAERQQRIVADAKERARAAFLDDLTELVDDWQQIDKHPQFHAYLAETDPDTGKQRQELLNEAVSALDATKVAKTFRAFLKRFPPSSAGAGAGGGQSASLAAQVVPPAAGGARAAPASDARIITRSEIATFYKDVATGKLRDPQKIATFEQEIAAANREGRIR